MFVSKLKQMTMMLMVVFLSACASGPNIDYDQNFNFSAIKTFKVIDEPIKKNKDPQLDNTLITSRIVRDIKSNLSQKGLTETTTNPDVKVDFVITRQTGFTSSSSRVSVGVGGFGGGYGHRSGMGMTYSMPVGDSQTFEEGILTINVVDNKKNTLIWTGSSSRELGKNRTPEAIDKTVKEVVDEILNKFPPGKS